MSKNLEDIMDGLAEALAGVDENLLALKEHYTAAERDQYYGLKTATEELRDLQRDLSIVVKDVSEAICGLESLIRLSTSDDVPADMARRWRRLVRLAIGINIGPGGMEEDILKAIAEEAKSLSDAQRLEAFRVRDST